MYIMFQDNGDCLALFENAGVDAAIPCDRTHCSLFQQRADECWGPCMKASCDWAQHQCKSERVIIAKCPILDAMALGSVQKAMSTAAGTAIYYPQGGTSDHFGRCISMSSQADSTPADNTCKDPAKPPSMSSMLSPGALLFDGSGNFVHGAFQALAAAAPFTIEMRFRANTPPPAQEGRMAILSLMPYLYLVPNSMPHWGPVSMEKRCNPFSWPDRDHGLICGECRVLVDKFSAKYKTCEGYCAAVGLGCRGAWEEHEDTCRVESDLTCTEALDSSDALCECHGGYTLTVLASYALCNMSLSVRTCL